MGGYDVGRKAVATACLVIGQSHSRRRSDGLDVRARRSRLGGPEPRHAVVHQQPGGNKGAHVHDQTQHDSFPTDEVAPAATPFAMIRTVGCLQISGPCKCTCYTEFCRFLSNVTRFQASLQNCGKRLLFFLVSGCSSFCLHVATRLPLLAFVSNLILEDSSKICREHGCFIRRPRHIYESPADFFFLWEILRTKVVLNIEKHILYSNFIIKNRAFVRYVEKCDRTG